MSYDFDLELIRELHPEPASSGSTDARGERSRRALLAAIDHASPPHPVQLGARWRLKLLAPVAALAVAVAAAVFVLGPWRGSASNPATAAAAVLQRAARAAAGGGPRRLRANQYWYVKSDWTINGAVFAGHPSLVIPDALTTTVRQAWIGVDRSGFIRTRVTGVRFLSPAARRDWIRQGRPPVLNPTARMPLPPDSFIRPYRQLLALPSNVNALWRVLKRGAGRGSPAWQRHEMFTEIGDLLREDPIPPKVRAALYLVAARIPDIRMLGLTHDDLGRPALAVGLNDTLYGIRDELLFDPKTSALLGESYVVVKPPPRYHVKPGTVRTGATYIISGIVNRIGQKP